jgi:transcriptional regulator with XRE-family HTH domain
MVSLYLLRMVIIMNQIGKNIKEYRERKGISQQELALKIRVGNGTIEKYETGTSIPTLQTILKISTVLDVPAAELMDHAYPNPRQ